MDGRIAADWTAIRADGGSRTDQVRQRSGRVAAGLRGCVVVRSCGYVVMWLYSYGYVAVLLGWLCSWCGYHAGVIRQASERCISRRSRRPPAGTRLTVAYLSSDLGSHPVRYTAPLLPHTDLAVRCSRVLDGAWTLHRGSRFRRIMYSLSNNFEWNGAAPLCDLLIPVAALSVAQLAARIQADGVQVLIDLNGNTMGHRRSVLSQRAAAVQLSLIGDNKSMGDKCSWDYIAADRTVRPAL